MIDGLKAHIQSLPPHQQQQMLNNIHKLPPREKAELFDMLDEVASREAKAAAQGGFLDFVKVMWPGFIMGRHHKIMAEKFEAVARGDIKRLAISLPPRHAIKTTEEIPTVGGWKLMGDIVPGDYVFGPDGAPTKVLGVSETFLNRPIFRAVTSDGFSLEVDVDHLWTVRVDRKSSKYATYTTEQLWERQNGATFKTTPLTGERYRTSWVVAAPRPPRLPDIAPAEYPPQSLLVDPYVLGVWLGDGAPDQSHISQHPDDAIFLRKEIERRGYVTTDQKTKSLFGILGLRVQLRGLGVLGNKHIPQQYLIASVAQRRDLLKGLIDTDGNVSKKGQCFFAQSSLPLINQVRELLASLGIKNTVSENEAKIGGVSYGATWRVTFYASDIAMLPRKESRTLKTPPYHGRYITIEQTPLTANTKCIKVDREDGLFLAGKGYICTHNTKSEFASYLLPAWYLGKYPERQIMEASHTAELAVGFGRKVRNLIDTADYQQIFPGTALQSDSKSAGRWGTNKGGVYNALGVGGSAAGKGANLFVIDDPFSEQDVITGNSAAIFDSVWEWYMSGPRQRLQPGGGIIVVHCMTGDTKVLMADGTQKELRHIKVGDRIATYEEGKVAASNVLNWQSNGFDSVYEIRTIGGTIARANERHPFLVELNGRREWIRLKDLRTGMRLVASRDVVDMETLSQTYSEPLDTYEIILDEIVSITPAGYEEVFDIQVERTENFIANGLVSHNTRWGKRDLIGRLLDYGAKNPEADQWEYIEFPAIMPSGASLWPEYWKVEELQKIKATIAPHLWNAQYMQNPTGEEGALLKREWWQDWTKEDPPKIDYIIMSLDAAQEAHNRADYNAVTVWGVFERVNDTGDAINNVILLEAWRERMEFPELKKAMYDMYKEWQPDTFIVEKKSNGAALYQEMRAAGIPVAEFTPGKGNDKISRVNAVSDMFSSGVIWAPKDRRWAQEVIDECAEFPNGDHDDLLDSTTQALIRVRKGGFLRLPTDYQDEPRDFRSQRKEGYY